MLSQGALEAAAAAGAAIERHADDKDATDLELALTYAAGRGCLRIIVIGGLGGRIDHLLGNAMVLASADLNEVAVEWWADGAHISLVRPGAPVERDSRAGDVVSLIAIAGPAGGVRTQGLRWRLGADTLQPGSTRGISNETTGRQFSVCLSDGVLFAIHYRRSQAA